MRSIDDLTAFTCSGISPCRLKRGARRCRLSRPLYPKARSAQACTGSRSRSNLTSNGFSFEIMENAPDAYELPSVFCMIIYDRRPAAAKPKNANTLIFILFHDYILLFAKMLSYLRSIELYIKKTPRSTSRRLKKILWCTFIF